MDFRISLRRAGGRMDVMSPKITAKVERLLNREVGKILVTECHDLLLRNEKSEFIFSGVSQLA